MFYCPSRCIQVEQTTFSKANGVENGLVSQNVRKKLCLIFAGIPFKNVGVVEDFP